MGLFLYHNYNSLHEDIPSINHLLIFEGESYYTIDPLRTESVPPKLLLWNPIDAEEQHRLTTHRSLVQLATDQFREERLDYEGPITLTHGVLAFSTASWITNLYVPDVPPRTTYINPHPTTLRRPHSVQLIITDRYDDSMERLDRHHVMDFFTASPYDDRLHLSGYDMI